MSNESNPLESIQEIKMYMQKSSRFLSLSGWSGIWVGTCGIIAGLLALYMVAEAKTELGGYDYFKGPKSDDINNTIQALRIKLIITALATFVIAVIGGFYFSARKAKKEGEVFMNHVFKRMFTNFSVPLITGGFVCLALIIYNVTMLIPSCTLIFYGLSLWTIARDTLNEVKKLAYCELILGILSLFFTEYNMIFWIIGFGFLHIIYGRIMKNKYEK